MDTKFLTNLMNEFSPSGKSKTDTIYIFHMRGGQSIRVPHIAELTMNSDNTGAFVGYSITWADGRRPAFFSLSIPDIIAVTVE